MKTILYILLLLPVMSFSQITIWSEDFEAGYSDDDITAQDNNTPIGPDWSISGVTNSFIRHWQVDNLAPIGGSRSMSGRNTDNEAVWISEPIDISGFENVSISMDMIEWFCESGDYIRTYYDVGMGNVEFGAGNGNGNFNSATNTTSVTGNTLIITVRLYNNGVVESILFDNILVQGDIVTPVEYLTFSAEQSNNKTSIQWATSMEHNNDYYTIQVSTDAMLWDSVKSIKGVGNTSTITHYQTDISIPNGEYYIRLKQTDFNGDFSYTDIVHIDVRLKDECTISNNKISISEDFMIYDLYGNNFTHLINDKELDLFRLKQGVYIIIGDSFRCKIVNGL